MSQIIKKSSDAAAPAASGKVIEREVIAASAEAMRIIEGAQAKAREILASAQQAREQAAKDGYEQGYAKGFEQWAKSVQSARASVKTAVEQAKPQIVGIALRVAEKILRQKLESRPDAMVPMIDDALRSLQGQGQMRVVLRVNPADQLVLEERRQRWLDRLPSVTSITIVGDETFPRGGCRIESDFGMVDATIETQVRMIERHLLGASAAEGS
jgi:type III secretion system HrpE/YscL family protein